MRPGYGLWSGEPPPPIFLRACGQKIRNAEVVRKFFSVKSSFGLCCHAVVSQEIDLQPVLFNSRRVTAKKGFHTKLCNFLSFQCYFYFVNNWRRISFLCQLDLLVSAGPYNGSIWTVLGLTEQMGTAWVLIFPKKETQLEKQDGGQGKCPFGGQISAQQGKVLSWLSSFGDNTPGLLSTRCKFCADRLNPGWASHVNASHTKVSNFRSDCIVFAVFC